MLTGSRSELAQAYGRASVPGRSWESNICRGPACREGHGPAAEWEVERRGAALAWERPLEARHAQNIFSQPQGCSQHGVDGTHQRAGGACAAPSFIVSRKNGEQQWRRGSRAERV